MKRKLLHIPHPSAAMIVALVALFVAMGGVGYAAYSVPDNSVGTNQLRHSSVVHSKLRFNSVSYQDIQQRAIGLRRADLNQLQERVGGTCAAGQAIGSIQNNGQVTCNAARPAEYGASGTAATTVAGAQVASLTLPAGSSYMVFANPSAKAAGAADDVTCTLTDGANKQSVTSRIPAGSSESLPLQVAGPAGTATVRCASTNGSTVTTAINALQTASTN